jgi:hypothetical protein
VDPATGEIIYPEYSLFYEILPCKREEMSRMRRYSVSLWPRNRSSPFHAALFVPDDSTPRDLFEQICGDFAAHLHPSDTDAQNRLSQRLATCWSSFFFYESNIRHLINFSTSSYSLADLLDSATLHFHEVGYAAALLIPVTQYHRRTNFGVPICFGTPFLFSVSPSESILDVLERLREFLDESRDTFYAWSFSVFFGQKLQQFDPTLTDRIDSLFPPASPIVRYSDRYLAIQRPNPKGVHTIVLANQGVKIRN